MAGHWQDTVGGQRQDVAGHDVPLTEAAALLNTTPEALRKKLQRGTMQGRKRRGQWYAWLPASVLTAGHDVQPGVLPRVDTAGGHVQPRPPAVSTLPPPVEVPDLRELVDHLQGEVAFLRGQLEARDATLASRDAEIERHQQLLLAALTSRPALAAEVGEAPAATLTPGPRPRWRFWRRH